MQDLGSFESGLSPVEGPSFYFCVNVASESESDLESESESELLESGSNSDSDM